MNTLIEISNKITQCSQNDRLEIIISLRAFLFDSPVYYWIDFTYSEDYEKDLYISIYTYVYRIPTEFDTEDAHIDYEETLRAAQGFRPDYTRLTLLVDQQEKQNIILIHFQQ